jgi:hypothetical protein
VSAQTTGTDPERGEQGHGDSWSDAHGRDVRGIEDDVADAQVGTVVGELHGVDDAGDAGLGGDVGAGGVDGLDLDGVGAGRAPRSMRRTSAPEASRMIAVPLAAARSRVRSMGGMAPAVPVSCTLDASASMVLPTRLSIWARLDDSPWAAMVSRRALMAAVCSSEANCAISATISAPSRGSSGSWFSSCATKSFRNSSWLGAPKADAVEFDVAAGVSRLDVMSLICMKSPDQATTRTPGRVGPTFGDADLGFVDAL